MLTCGKRAERVLERRPSLSSPGDLAAATDQVMAMLQSGSPELLTALRFDEAREILEQRAQDLRRPSSGRRSPTSRAGLPPGSQAPGCPGGPTSRAPRRSDEAPTQRDAARELLDLDDAQQQQLFTRETRIKLERLLRDKAVNGSNPSCPEAAFIRAAQQLGGLIDRIEVLAPTPPTGTASTNRTGAGKMLTLACARLRLGWLMREWDRDRRRSRRAAAQGRQTTRICLTYAGQLRRCGPCLGCPAARRSSSGLPTSRATPSRSTGVPTSTTSRCSAPRCCSPPNPH